MANSMSSKTKVAFISGVGASIVEANKKLSTVMEEVHGVANSAQYAAVDRVYNVLADLSTMFSDVLCNKDKKVLLSIAEGLTKRTDVGEAFVSSAKKTRDEIESIPASTTFDKINVERDGSETWDSGMRGRLTDAIETWANIRKTFITDFSASFSKIEEEEFRTAVKPIGRANEEFTNSIAKNVNNITEALEELGISTDKFNANVTETATSTGIEEANIKPNLMGFDV